MGLGNVGTQWLGRVALACAGLSMLARCSSDDEGALDRAANGGDFDASSPCLGGGCGAGGTSGSGGGAGLPPEQEVESSFRSPVATGRYVWSANPQSGRVARVDAVSLEVRTVEAGFGPTYLAAVPTTSADANRAVVINALSHDATVLTVRSESDIDAKTVRLHQGANSWAMSPQGRWAIAWTDASKFTIPDPTEGFQDITVVDLQGEQPRATRLSVGYRPTRLFISNDETRAFAVTEPGVTVVALDAVGGPTVTSDVPVTDNPLDDPASRDVTVTADGALALVRRDGSAFVNIVSLVTGAIVPVELSGPVTDLDLSEDGTRAVAVVRRPTPPVVDAGTGNAGAAGAASSSDAGAEAASAEGGALEAGVSDAANTGDAPPVPPAELDSEVVVLPVPAIFDNPGAFDSISIAGETVGSVVLAPNAKVALLFTNAEPNDHLTILDLDAGTTYLKHRTVALKAPVKAVFVAPDALHAIAMLAPGAGSSKAGAFSVVPIASTLPPKIEATDAPLFAVALGPAPTERGLVVTRDELRNVFGAYLVRMPELQVDRFPLSTAPLAAGIVEDAHKAFIAQEHPEGRLTFIDLTTGAARTLTGFELGAKVVDGT
jgi:hypothetical protein